jgi:serine O-acetyltransferase
MALPQPAQDLSLWDTIRRDAAAIATREPALAARLHQSILNQTGFAEALAHLIADALGGGERAETRLMAVDAYRADPALIALALQDLAAPVERDPACAGALHVLLHFKGYLALQAFRLSHRLWRDGRCERARLLQDRTSRALHVSIHPSAKIGGGAFVDHGTGLTIGTCVEIGTELSILQGATIVAESSGSGAPRLGQGVLVSAGAIIIGAIEIGDYAKVGAGSLVTMSVPSGCTAVGVPARLVNCTPGARPAASMDQSLP